MRNVPDTRLSNALLTSAEMLMTFFSTNSSQLIIASASNFEDTFQELNASRQVNLHLIRQHTL